ncbi:MAG TPA: hypothetical protein VGR24_02385 [bacterium]|nr:hypothetical protein [bacterium]
MGGRRSGIIVLALGLILVVAGFTLAWGTQQDTNPAMNHPHAFAWKVFVEINRSANNGSNDVVWETWATDPDTFPPTGDPSACVGTRTDPKRCPTWPGAKHRRDELQPVAKQLAAGVRSEPQEVVYRNKPAYDYIVSNNLWFRDGLIDAFRRAQAGDFTVAFPINGIETKAIWVEINVRDKPRYHWNYASDGRLYGLTALHIMTKDIPAWFWATFEHVDNIGRCDFIGCHDTFGSTPFNVPPKATDGGLYDAGRPTAALVAMFRRAGMGPEWYNYRLKGTQTDFVDVTGNPIRLGNSQLEEGFVPTASCMTCHARSTVNGAGMTLNVFRSRQPLQGNLGVPDRSWFFNPDGSLRMLPMDFVWAFIKVLRQLPPDGR